MATEVAALVARLEADTRKFDRGMKGAEKRLKGFDKQGDTTRRSLGKTDKSVGGLTKSVKGFALAAGAAFGTKVVVDFAKDAIGAASDLGESINAVEVVFGDASEAILKLSDDAAESVGLSKVQFNDLAVGFSAFVEKINEETEGDFASSMDDLTTRIADFASVMNLDVAEAAVIFRSGLAGETEPLRKFGIDVSAAAVTVEALESGLAGTASELTEQDKLLARYNLIMDQTQKTQGDFANTSDSLANATRILTAKFEDAKAEIGSALIPTIEDLLPLLEKGIDKIVIWAIAFGQLTGSISDVEAATRKSKLGLDKEVTALDFVKEASKQLSRELRPGLFDSFGALGGVVIDTAGTAFKQLIDETDNIIETFGLAADDADNLRNHTAVMADEFGITEDAVLELADRIDEDLIKTMQEAASVQGNELLQSTQDVRDAVLDGKDAVFDLIEADEDLVDGFKDIQTEAKKAADRIQGLRDKMQALTDPAFALISAAKNYKSALDTQNEALETYGENSGEAFDAGVDVLTNFQDLIFAADEYAQVTNTDVATALLTMGEKAGVPLAVIRDIIEALDEADNFAGEAEFTVRYIEENRRALDDFLAVNIGAGAPGGLTTVIPTSNGGTRFHQGGVVPGPPGVTVPILAQAGETIRTTQQERALQSGGTTVQLINAGVIGSKAELARWLEEALETVRRQ